MTAPIEALDQNPLSLAEFLADGGCCTDCYPQWLTDQRVLGLVREWLRTGSGETAARIVGLTASNPATRQAWGELLAADTVKKRDAAFAWLLQVVA